MSGNGGESTDVVSMTEREQARRRAALRLVEAYWLGLCAEDQVPMRSQVDPRGMEAALENAFLIERIAPGLAKFRVAGSHLSDLMGMQVAGMPLSMMIAPEDRDRLAEAVTRLFAEPALLRIELGSEDGFGKPAMSGALLLLPLRSDFGDITRGLGALVTDGRIGRTPRRFRIRDVTVEPAIGPGAPRRAAPEPEAQPLPRLHPARGLAEAPARFVKRGRGYLRLVVKND